MLQGRKSKRPKDFSMHVGDLILRKHLACLGEVRARERLKRILDKGTENFNKNTIACHKYQINTKLIFIM